MTTQNKSFMILDLVMISCIGTPKEKATKGKIDTLNLIKTQTSPLLCDNLEGQDGEEGGKWGVQEGGDIRVRVADSCMAKTITML